MLQSQDTTQTARPASADRVRADLRPGSTSMITVAGVVAVPEGRAVGPSCSVGLGICRTDCRLDQERGGRARRSSISPVRYASRLAPTRTDARDRSALVGMPGGGKSTVGRHLARHLGARSSTPTTRSSADRLLDPRVLRARGRGALSRHRTARSSPTLTARARRACWPPAAAPCCARPTAQALRSASTVVYLRSTPEELFRRLRHDTHRPLLQVADPLRRLRDLYRERDPLYRDDRALHDRDRPALGADAGQHDPDAAGAGRPGRRRARCRRRSTAPRRRSTRLTVASAAGRADRTLAPMGRDTPIPARSGTRPDRPRRPQLRHPDRSRPARRRARASRACRRRRSAVIVTQHAPSRRCTRDAPESRRSRPRTAQVLLHRAARRRGAQGLGRAEPDLRRLLGAGCDRKTVLFALGGGVVGDMTGFAAACYMRGVPFVQVPTTLLAQVDSSVGGKTAINHPLGKNMIGAFYQPLRVVADLDDAGHAAAARDRRRPGRGHQVRPDRRRRRSSTGSRRISMPCWRATRRRWRTRCAARARSRPRWSAQDERESGLRAILNFGHTFGHAIEAGLGYGDWLHGEAVGCGMVMAADLSARLGLIDAAYVAAHCAADRARGPAGRRPGAGRRALPRADARRQEGRGRRDPLRA